MCYEKKRGNERKKNEEKIRKNKRKEEQKKGRTKERKNKRKEEQKKGRMKEVRKKKQKVKTRIIITRESLKTLKTFFFLTIIDFATIVYPDSLVTIF